MNTLSSSHKKRVAVLRGGHHSQHHHSLASGKGVLEHLDKDHFVPVDIYIDKTGAWHLDGVVATPYAATRFVDVLINSMHGDGAEDGALQRILEEVETPYIGSDSFTSFVTIDKHKTKLLLAKAGIAMPRSEVVRHYEKDEHTERRLALLWQKMHHPLVLKPVRGSRGEHITLVRTYTELIEKVKKFRRAGNDTLVEEYVEGKSVSVCVIQDLREKKLYTTIPLHVQLSKDGRKYHFTPLHLSGAEKQVLADMVETIQSTLHLRHYYQIDCILTTKGNLYFLEVNTLPSLIEGGLLHNALSASGVGMKEFLSHMAHTATEGK